MPTDKPVKAKSLRNALMIMLPKIQGAVEALHAGVNKVHLIDSALPHSLLLELFTDKGVGTEIVH